jgi:non-specific serine/threonine protein kinase
MGRALSGDTEGAYAAAEEAVALAREVGDKVTLGFALTNMAGVIAVTRHDLDGVRTDGEEGIRLLREAGSRRLTGNMLFGYGVFAAAQGYYDEARSHFNDSLELFAELGDSHPLAMIHSELAHLERRQGHLAQAKSLYRQTLQEWGKIGHRAAMAHDLECFAFIAKAQEEEQRAARLFGAAEILREGAKLPMNHIEQVEYDREVNDLRANMNGSAFTTAWAEGRMMTLEQAVEYALSLPPAPATPLETHDEFGGLTERELEIVSLIGQGKSNGEIATELVLSKRTVEKHVANILSKLELSSRAQIVRWAMVHNLTSKPSL